MFEKEVQRRKQELGIEWIKSPETGETFLCPVGAIKDKENVSQEELSRLCSNESLNPQND